MKRFRPGSVFSEEVTLSKDLVERFAELSGDHNPVHLRSQAAREYGFSRPIAHGAILSAVVSKLIGTKVPGPGAVWLSQSMEWTKPVFVGDTVRVEAEVASASTGVEVITLKLRALDSRGEEVMRGSAKVKVAPKVAEQPGTSDSERRVALVTGGSRGIGAAIARELGASGFQVALTYKSNRAAAEAVAGSITRAGGAAEVLEAELGLTGSGGELLDRLTARFGRIDVVVHAATEALPSATAMETTVDDLRRCARIHVEAALELARAAAPDMAQRKHGRLIFLGTSALFGAPPPRRAAYVAAKQGLWGLVRCLASELGPDGITVNMISPGMTVTDLNADVPQRLKEAEARRTALRRLAVPEDVARVAAFLASDAGGYLTGQNLPITGGCV